MSLGSFPGVPLFSACERLATNPKSSRTKGLRMSKQSGGTKEILLESENFTKIRFALKEVVGPLVVPRLRGTAALQVIEGHQNFDRELEGAGPSVASRTMEALLACSN